MTIEWSDQLVTDICDHLATGKSLIEIGALKGYPSSDSMYRQMHRDADFAARIAHAREAGQDHEADACVQMADLADVENWQVVKLRIHTRQWRAAKLNPRYGEKLDVKHSGEVATRHDLSIYSAAELDTLEQLVAKGSDPPRDQG